MTAEKPADRPRTMTPVAWIVVVVGVAGFIGAIIWLGATPAPRIPNGSRTLLENPGAIVVAIISAIAVLGAPVVAKLSAVQRQVQNSHSVNLRDDLDDKHDENAARLDRIFTAINKLDGRLVNVETAQVVILRTVDRQIARIDELEETQPKKGNQ